MPKAMPEDLINLVIAANDLRRPALGLPPTHFNPSQRFLIEPIFTFLGLLVGFMTLALPWPLRKPCVQWVVQSMGGHAPENNPELPRRLSETIHLANDLKTRTGQWPAFLVLTSHPDTEGPLHWLRFEVLRQGL